MHRWSRAEAEVLAEMARFPLESRAAVGLRLGRSKASVARLVERLLKDGAIVEAGRPATPRRGRRTTTLRLRSDLGYLIGADLEGLAGRACVLDCSRQVVASGRQAMEPGWSMAQRVESWVALIGEVIRKSGVPRERLVGLGVGLPGVVLADDLRTHAQFPPHGRVSFDLKPALSGLGLPCVAANNALCVAEYERRTGQAAGATSFIAVLVRYGVGAAIFADGHFLTGNGVFAGEMGHMCVDLGGPVCVCGQRGCLDAYVSGRTWPPPEQRGGAAWREDLERRARLLGMGAANLLKLCHTPLVILNGIYNEYEPTVLPAMRAELLAALSPLGLSPAAVVCGEPVDGKASIGAALRAADAFMVPYLSQSEGV